MRNSKNIYILESDLMKVITKAIRILWISFIIFVFYPQCMCKSSELLVNKKIDISGKSIKKDLDYLKEDIKLPIFINGKDINRVEIINSNISDRIVDNITKTEEAVKDEFDSVKERPNFPYEIKSFYTVTEQNDSIISIYNDYYEYLGGAHGSTIRNGYTIDRNDERIVILDDLFVEGFDYKDIINKNIKEGIIKEPDKYFYSPENFKGIADNQGFYIKDDNLIIFFNEYEIAPYVAGIPEFKIPLKEFGRNFIYSI